MKGNLSKKKGFLGELDETGIRSIADVIGERTDARLDSAEIAISDINEKIPKLKDELTEYTDNLVNEVYAGIESLEKTVKEKEDISNKLMTADDDGCYYSGQMTEMRIYQVIDEHIVQDLSISKEDRVPSVKAVSDADKVITEKIDEVKYIAEDAYSLAAGAGRAIVFEDYQAFCRYILEEGSKFEENYPLGTTILIGETGVPDLWYYGKADNYTENIPTNQEIAGTLQGFGYFDIGYYRFAQSEGSKVILDGYVQLGDFIDHVTAPGIHITQTEKENWNNKLDKATSQGGFTAGDYTESDDSSETRGVIIGKHAQPYQVGQESPVTIGEGASGDGGVAIGYKASAYSNGTVVGVNASGGGVSIGEGAKAFADIEVVVDGEVVEVLKDHPIDAIQLGEGTNKEEKTFQVYDFQLLDAEGNIPKERLKNAGGDGGGSVDLSDYYNKDETDTKISDAIGDIESALDSIITLQTQY